MEPTDLTIQILTSIRDEIRGLGARIDQTNVRLDETNARLDRFEKRVDARFESLERRLTETEIRLASELVAVAQSVNTLTEFLRRRFLLKKKVDDHELRLVKLKARLAG